VANGENAFAFDSGTARFNLDERQILGASEYTAGVSSSYGTGAGAFTNVTLATATGITADSKVTLSATAGAYDYVNNTFTSFTVTATNSNGSASQANNISVGATAATFASIGSASFTATVNALELKYLAVSGSAGSAEITGTEVANGSGFTGGTFSVAAASGFLDNAISNVTITVSGSADNATLSFSDGLGGTVTQANVNLSAAAVGSSVVLTVSGGVNNGATFTLAYSSAGVGTGTVSGTVDYKVRGDFTGTRSAAFDVRGVNAGESATLDTEQQVDGTDANNLTVQLNETNTSTVTVVSQNVQTDGQGLQLDFAQNAWNDRADIDNAIRQLDAAKLKLRSASSALSTNLNIITVRETFTKEFSDVLKEGAGKLTLADQNEEGANILTLQTRQQLGTISLSLANQAQQAILRLF
jgi:flagellin-like hook-associated protein FlgL